MKPLLLIVLATLAFSCSTTAPINSQTATEGGGSPTASANPNVIFEYAPQNVDSLITFEAFDAYENKYKSVPGFKSFAQSEGGAWAYVTNRDSQDIADLHVLKSCEKYNLKYTDSYPCKLINVSGKWLNYPKRALEILDSLPEFTPETPIDLSQLRSNTNKDMQNKDYAMALAKRVWFHQHALEVNEHYSAVRLSFGLMDWAELGKVYPPAKTLLRYLANYAKSTLMNKPKEAYSLIHEYVSINRVLERTDQSLSFFNWLDNHHPETAARNFHIFQDVLTQHEQFSLYNKYLNPNVDFSQMVSTYVWSKDARKRGVYGDTEKSQKMLEFDTKTFIYNVSRLVAILVINGRSAETENIIEKAKLELDSDEFITALNNAQGGKLPPS
ncbi:hypothetical protein [Paraglaciecola sp.]|uniref:hypothetical protein n=1 Tax=Paraglaciecola sp. TaxID=1920173 RepID=UPI0030F3AE27